MDLPNSKVLSVIRMLDKKKDSKNLADFKLEINNLTPSERMQFFLLVKDLRIDVSDFFSIEIILWEKFQAIFRNDYIDALPVLQNLEIALDLVETALLMEIYDLEDFRTIIRFLYTSTESIETLLVRITKTLLRYLSNKDTKVQTLSQLNSHIRFLGIPFLSSDEMKNEFLRFFPENKSEILNFFELPIKTCQQYPEYIDEISEQIEYDKDIPFLKDWLDHETLSKIEKTKISHFVESFHPQPVNSNSSFIKNLQLQLKKEKLSSIPLVYDSFIKPYISYFKPEKVKSEDINTNIPSEVLQKYVEKLAYPVYCHKDKKIKVTFLGGAQIGTMGILISTSESNILVDYGLSVANYQIPYWHEALNHLDAIFITHAHLDHIGSIPYLYAIGYDGYVFGTNMTKNFSNFLLIDNHDLMNKNFSSLIRREDFRFRYLSESKYIFQMLDHYITINSNNEYQITSDVVIKTYPTNHIQGSLAYLITYGEKKILFTGDLNLDSTALFGDSSPKLPHDSDLTIVDSTYFGHPSFNTKKRDELLLQTVKEDKRVIIPAFSIGRAQEIMVKLDNLGMTKQRKISMLGMATKVARITGLKTNGYLSNHLVKPFDEEIVIAGGGMLGGGNARDLVEQTKDDPDTTILLCGYLAKNTLGYRLLHKLEPQYKQKVIFTRFSGHSSSETLTKFLGSLQGKKALVHLGDLTREPFESEKKRQKMINSDLNYHIPSLGSSLEI